MECTASVLFLKLKHTFELCESFEITQILHSILILLNITLVNVIKLITQSHLLHIFLCFKRTQNSQSMQ